MRHRSSPLAFALLLVLNASPAFAVVAAGGLNNSDDQPAKTRSAPAPAAPAPGAPAPAPVEDLEAAPAPAPMERSAGTPAPMPKPAGQAVATVNGVGIPKAEYDRVYAMIKRRYQGRFGIDFNSPRGKEMEDELKLNLINHLVEKQLVLNEGLRRGLQVAPDQVDAKLSELKKESGSDEEFQNNLKANGMTLADLRREVEDGLLVRQVADALTSDIKVTDEEAKAYYDSHSEEFDKPEEVRVRHILVKDKATAEKLLADLKGGADFATLAKANSEDPGSKNDGGDLGFFSRGRMVPEFEDVAFKLKPGELSGIVQTQFGFHILQGVEHHDARHVPFDEAKPKIAETLSEGRKDKVLSKWLEDQKKAAKITYAPGYAPTPKPTPKPSPKPTPKPKPRYK
jgi:foldase protein PrsA